MNKRPHSITVIGWIFIAFGAIALFNSLLPTVDPATAGRTAEFEAKHSFEHLPVQILRILAVVGGGLTLGGFNCGRWLLAVWIAYHVILSVFHSTFEVVVHGSLFAVTAYFLFRPQATAYFRPQPASTNEPREGGHVE